MKTNEYEFKDGELKSVEKISVLECGTVFIEYTTTNKFMKEYGLEFKHRILEINPLSNNSPKFKSYANVKE